MTPTTGEARAWRAPMTKRTYNRRIRSPMAAHSHAPDLHAQRFGCSRTAHAKRCRNDARAPRSSIAPTHPRNISSTCEEALALAFAIGSHFTSHLRFLAYDSPDGSHFTSHLRFLAYDSPDTKALRSVMPLPRMRAWTVAIGSHFTSHLRFLAYDSPDTKALRSVMPLPRMRAWTSWVPSYVFTVSRLTRWRMIWYSS